MITCIVGSVSIPQNVTNSGNVYIGTAEEYNAELYKAQIGSRGFRIAMIGVGVFACGILGFLCVALYYKKYEIQPQTLQRSVRINPAPTVIDIPSNSCESKEENIRKWTGGTMIV